MTGLSSEREAESARKDGGREEGVRVPWEAVEHNPVELFAFCLGERLDCSLTRWIWCLIVPRVTMNEESVRRGKTPHLFCQASSLSLLLPPFDPPPLPTLDYHIRSLRILFTLSPIVLNVRIPFHYVTRSL